jgi:hypothetical protein
MVCGTASQHLIEIIFHGSGFLIEEGPAKNPFADQILSGRFAIRHFVVKSRTDKLCKQKTKIERPGSEAATSNGRVEQAQPDGRNLQRPERHYDERNVERLRHVAPRTKNQKRLLALSTCDCKCILCIASGSSTGNAQIAIRTSQLYIRSPCWNAAVESARSALIHPYGKLSLRKISMRIRSWSGMIGSPRQCASRIRAAERASWPGS